MGLPTILKDGLVFVSNLYSLHRGAYTYAAERPSVCDKCLSDAGGFHAHGRYQRRLKTMRNWRLTEVLIWIQRWLCVRCRHTISTKPPDVISHLPNCTLVIVALVWAYVAGDKGLHNAIPGELCEAADATTLARYVKKAKTVCEQTQQAIREVLSQIKGPRPWDECFAQGLSPPQSFFKRHADDSSTCTLWKALAMLLAAAEALSTPPCLLMARARTTATERNLRFLL
jgi:hypothetical protein